MKKLLLILAVVVATASFANAQDKKWNIGVGGGLTLPTGDASDYFKTGFNGFVNGTYNFTSKFAAGVEINYLSLPGKTIDVTIPGFGTIDDVIGSADLKMTAFLAKGVYTFTESGLRPYLGVNLGFYKPEEGDSEFGYALEGGVKFGKFNIGAGYHVATSDFKFLQINAGYTFNF